MKTQTTNLMKLFASVLFFFMLAVNGFAQSYACMIKNITVVNSKQINFDVWLENTGDSSLFLQALQGGITIGNYAEIAGNGILSGAFVPSSADASLPEKQQSPNWRINSNSHNIQLLAAIAKTADEAAIIPSHSAGGIKLGTFALTNTVDFPTNSTPDLNWSFSAGNVNATRTLLTCYVGTDAPKGTNITNPSSHTVVH